MSGSQRRINLSRGRGKVRIHLVGLTSSEKPGMLPFEWLFWGRWLCSLTPKTCFHPTCPNNGSS